GGGETPPDDGGTGTPPDDGGSGTPPDDGGSGTPPDDGGSGTPPDDGGSGTPPDDGGSGTPPDDGGGATHTEIPLRVLTADYMSASSGIVGGSPGSDQAVTLQVEEGASEGTAELSLGPVVLPVYDSATFTSY